jgi:dimethylaniline monooxygenase (N-oxide forming)
MTRIAATFTPSFMNGKSWWTHLLHSTSYGVKAMNAFWGTVDAEARKEADFEGRENLQGFEKLAPHSS